MSTSTPLQSPAFPCQRTGLLPFCTSHPQACAQNSAEPMRKPPCHAVPAVAVIARRPKAAGVTTPTSSAAFTRTGLPRGLQLSDGSRAPACWEVTRAPGACLPPSPCDHLWFPAPQGAGRTMFSPSTTAARSHFGGGFETTNEVLKAASRVAGITPAALSGRRSLRAGMLRGPGAALPD